ncbi:hypothetical protein P3G55_22660 [Leptospira sp. 96542]|nr:hypothetical protein [Leptospira sp. 96542]
MSLVELDDPQRAVQVDLYMDGAAFDEGIPVHLLLQGFETAQTILDRAYLGLAGRSRFTVEERRHFFLLTKSVKHSSLDSWMDLVLTGVQTSLPVFGALGPTGIWEYSKQAYELLKFAYEAVKHGQQPTYQHTGDGNLEVNNGTVINVYNAPVFNIARASQRVYVDMAKNVTSGAISSFSLSDAHGGAGIRIAQNEAEFFDVPSTIDPEPIDLDCEIFDFNKFEDSGKLRVFDGQALPMKDYRFSVVGNQADSDYIEAMLRRSVRITCLREITVDPLAQEKVVRLQVLKVAA